MKKVSLSIVLLMIFLLGLSSMGLSQSPQSKDPLESDRLFSLRVRDVDIRDVLTIIAQEYGLNLILSPAVLGRITYDIENTSLRDGFNAILRSSGLTYVIDGNIIRVDEQGELRKKLRTELDIYKARQELREAQKLEKPLETSYVNLNYIGTTLSKEKGGETTDLQDAMENLLSHKKEKGVDRGANVSIIRKTNTLVITDVEENVREIAEMAKKLDLPTGQVRIDARIVETNRDFSRELGIRWGGQGVFDTGEGTLSVGGPAGGDVVNLPVTNPAATFSLGWLSTTVDLRRLDIELTALETTGDVKIISKPSLLVVQNQEAEIFVGEKVPVAEGYDAETAQVSIRLEDVGTKLKITPQIARDGSIFMLVDVEKSEILGETTIQGMTYDTLGTKRASTQVLAKDGETVVIGGLLSTKKQANRERVPVLSKIPILGLLFKSKQDISVYRELLIFITPQIIT
ncbi:MAG: secretin and TonB N-terminal domain-containing protein [Syntrophobacterales bacterium]|nr:MAG: secretin and TonB N-terminal domain-containing protein [Syntrophobacterales bacterium]